MSCAQGSVFEVRFFFYRSEGTLLRSPCAFETQGGPFTVACLCPVDNLIFQVID